MVRCRLSKISRCGDVALPCCRPLRFQARGKERHIPVHLLSGPLRASSSTTRGAAAAGDLASLLVRVAAGDVSPAAAVSKLSPLLVSGGAEAEDVGGYAKVDHDRRVRVGFPEVVFGEGKSAAQIVKILTAMIRNAEGTRDEDAGTGASAAASPIVATRVSAEKWAQISRDLPGQLTYHADARVVYFGAPPSVQEGSSIGKVAVLSAGTSDLATAEEAAVLAELSGVEVRRGNARQHGMLSTLFFGDRMPHFGD